MKSALPMLLVVTARLPTSTDALLPKYTPFGLSRNTWPVAVILPKIWLALLSRTRLRLGDGTTPAGTPAACTGTPATRQSATARGARTAAKRPRRLPRLREISETGTHEPRASFQITRKIRLMLACAFIG